MISESAENEWNRHWTYVDVLGAYQDAAQTYFALRSQGKFCPPGVAQIAKLHMLELEQKIRRYQTFRKILLHC